MALNTTSSVRPKSPKASERNLRARRKSRSRNLRGRQREEKVDPSPKPNVVAFEHPPEKEDEDDEDDEIAELKKQVRLAMAVLEEGKAVAAFNLLKRIVE